MKPYLNLLFVILVAWPLHGIISRPINQKSQSQNFPDLNQMDSLQALGKISSDSLINYYLQVAHNYRDAHDFQSARQVAARVFDILPANEAENYRAMNHALLADMAMEEDDIPTALNHLTTVLKIYETSGDSVNYLHTLRKIGINYDYIGDHDAARKYYDECIALAEQLGMESVIGNCYNTIAGILSDDGDFESGLDYYRKGIEIARKVGDNELLHKLYLNMSLTYDEMGLFSQSKSHLDRSRTIAEEMEDLKLVGFSNQGLGFYYLSMGKLDSAEYFMNKTLVIANQINNAQLNTNARSVLEEIFYETGRYKQAYDLSKELTAEYDSMYNIENSRLIESVKAKYQTEKQERELVEKNYQLQQADYILSEQKNLQTIMFLVLVLLLVIIFLIYRGYTLRKKANDLLKARNAEVEAHATHVENLNKTRNRWFINVAHELRTPLTLIKGPVNRVINHYQLPQDVKEDLQLVENSANSLANLVNEILDLSKLESGKIELKEASFDLCDLIDRVKNSFQSRAEHLRLSLTCNSPEQLFIEGDADKIEKVIVNLVANALKFTPRGGRVHLKVSADSQKIEVEVSDTGKGINPEDLPFVFDRFFQSSDPEDQASGGTGIGLSLSKEIAELHDGRLEVQSQKGKGSTFSFILPAKRHVKIAGQDHMQHDIEEMELDTQNMPKLLLVDDNPEMRKYVSSLLMDYFEIVEAQDGEEALLVLAQQNIAFIISDVMMDGMDGVSFLKKVKANPEWSTLPFIHLTAYSDDKLKQDAFNIGVDDFLIKPFDPDELTIRVRNLYDNYLNRTALATPNSMEDYDGEMINKLREVVMSYIDDNQFNVIRLAHEGGMSERQLYRYLKSTTGLTPLQFIQEIKLMTANELVRNKPFANTSELAAAVGFKQSSYFASLFEKRFGKKPSVLIKP